MGQKNGSYSLVVRKYKLINVLLGRYIFARTYASVSEEVKGKKSDEKMEELSASLTEDHAEGDGHDEEDLEAQIIAKRDVSRMPAFLRRKMYHREEIPPFEFTYQFDRKYKRSLYGKMGKASGVDPSLFYPFEDELKEMLEERELFEPPLEELIASAQAKVDEAERERIKK